MISFFNKQIDGALTCSISFSPSSCIAIDSMISHSLLYFERQTTTVFWNSALHVHLVQCDTNEVLKEFTTAFHGLEFTCKVPENSALQFLDIKLFFEEQHTCFMYKKRREKGIMRFYSSHSKIVKRGVAMSCLKQVLG